MICENNPDDNIIRRQNRMFGYLGLTVKVVKSFRFGSCSTINCVEQFSERFYSLQIYGLFGMVAASKTSQSIHSHLVLYTVLGLC